MSMNNIKLKDNIMYYKEIIHPNEFRKLYLKEKPLQRFLSRITTDTKRPFFTFYSEDRKPLDFKEEDIVIIRIFKENKQVQFVSKIYKWGKIHISKEIIQLLNIKNHERIRFYIIARDQELKLKNEEKMLDLCGISRDNIRTIPRGYNYITIYSKQKTSITLPRFIKITPKLLELVYLIHGDGHYQNKLYFVNKNPELHKFVLEQFNDIFKIPKDLWKVRILISDLSMGGYAKGYWKDKLNLDEKQFYNLSKSELKTNRVGNLRVIIDQTIVSSVFRFIFNQLKQLDRENSLYALNGLLCAEGGAQLSKDSLHKITLSFNKKEENMFKELLDNLDLRYSIEHDRTFVIRGWNNQCLFFKTFLSKDTIPFRFHNQRRNNAMGGFLSHSFTKTMIKYLSVLKEKGDISIKEFSDLLGIRKDSVLNTLRKKRYNKFINFKKKKNFFIISISKEGLTFLDLIQKIRRDYMGELPFEKIEREILIKKEAQTDERYGKKPEERSVEELIDYGIVNINKPQGPTSHQVSDYVQKILGIKKAGHSGTLVM